MLKCLVSLFANNKKIVCFKLYILGCALFLSQPFKKLTYLLLFLSKLSRILNLGELLLQEWSKSVTVLCSTPLEKTKDGDSIQSKWIKWIYSSYC